MKFAAHVIAALAAFLAQAAQAREFKVRSADGTEIGGVAEVPAQPARIAIIFVPGTGLFDRDAPFGKSNTPRDLIFKDLSARMVARGVATVRYDVRGIRYGMPPDQLIDLKLLAGRTTQNMREDVAAVYDWTRSADGPGTRCTAFFAHSEGMIHVARLAEAGTPPPALVIGMGAAMEGPSVTLRWQLTGRDADSLEMMDADRNGIVTNDEVKANLSRTPSGAHGVLDPFLHPSGQWTATDIAQVRTVQAQLYAKHKQETMAHADTDPYPKAETPFTAYEWWKSWFIDDVPAGVRLMRWTTPVILHYGDKDSQTPAARQIAAAKRHLPADRLNIHLHSDRGHTLGPDVLFGPIEEAIADRIAEEAARAPC
jgi:hypothetical protein